MFSFPKYLNCDVSVGNCKWWMMKAIFKNILMWSLVLGGVKAKAQFYNKEEGLKHTYSIVARDEKTGELGVAVQSHWFGVGNVVAWAKPGVGAVATQAMANISLGPKTLDLLAKGLSPEEALEKLLAEDQGASYRQLAAVDQYGNSAVHTGENCIQYAGHLSGRNYSVQANMMLKDGVIAAMDKAWHATSGQPLAERMLQVLEAAEGAGGDIRGRQSASLLVVRGTTTPNVWEERLIDLRVDDHEEPLIELRRLYKTHTAYQFMNQGDLYMEQGDTASAMVAYREAMHLLPDNPEMPFWAGITMAQNGKMEEALQLLRPIFRQNPHWKELTKRLIPVGLLKLNDADLKLLLE
jgi:uncharacterized Ntn-hydrolase superfamily protein